jgi:DNA polymerase III sliding clamp (beta) subunit (PCNA family)
LLRTIEDEHVIIGIDPVKDILTITSAQDEFSIKGISATEFVAVPTVQSDRELTLDIHSFTKGIGKVEYAVMEKNFSPVLT